MKKNESSNLKQQQEAIFAVSEKYFKGKKKEKIEIIDFLEKHFGMGRDHLARTLRRMSKEDSPSWRLSQRGRKTKYCELCRKHLEKLYVEMGRPGAETMKVALGLYLPFYIAEKQLSAEISAKLSAVSERTIGRLLKPLKDSEFTRNNSQTRAPRNFAYKDKIAVPDLSHQPKVPGYFQGDTVAHHGHSMMGPHHWSLTATDVATTWTELEIMAAKTGRSTYEAMVKIQERLPFLMRAWHSDNGMEFMNEEVQEGLADAKNYVVQTRGRPYKKNDQCYVEQKNFTHVRQLVGYYRYDQQEELEIIQDIYRNEWRLLLNFFTPQRKMIEKFKIGSRYKRKYDKLQTPYQRVMASEQVSQIEKDKLKTTFESLNPLSLRASLREKLRKLKLVKQRSEEKEAA